MPEYEIYNNKNYNKPKTTTAPFPSCIARDQCSKPIIHFIFMIVTEKLCQPFSASFSFCSGKLWKDLHLSLKVCESTAGRLACLRVGKMDTKHKDPIPIVIGIGSRGSQSFCIKELLYAQEYDWPLLCHERGRAQTVKQ